MSIAGDVTLEQVAEAHPDVAPALALILDGDLTKTRKTLDREIRAIPPQKTELQNRIDENLQALAALEQPKNLEQLERAATEAANNEDTVRETLAALSRGDNTEARNKIAALQQEIHDLRDAQIKKHKQAVAHERHELEQERDRTQAEADQARKILAKTETALTDDERDERRMATETKDLEMHVTTLQKGAETAITNRDDLRNQWANLANEPVTVTARDVTPTESTLIEAALSLVNALEDVDLPNDAEMATKELVAQCDAAKYGMSADEAQAAAEKAKHEELDKLAETGKEANQVAEERQRDLDAAAANLKVLRENLLDMTGQVTLSRAALEQARTSSQAATQAATQARDALANLTAAPEDPTEWAHLTQQIEELKQAIETPNGNIDAIQQQYTEAKERALTARNNVALAQATINVAVSTEARIEELKTQYANVVTDHEQLLKNRDTLDKLARKQVEMLDENLDNTFKVAKFQLLRINYEGNLEEICRIYTQNGVPFNATNEAEQAAIALDIALAKQTAIGINAPIIIDSRESYLSLPLHLDGHQFVTMQVTDTQGEPLQVEKVNQE